MHEAVFVSPEVVSKPPRPLKKLWVREYMSDLNGRCSISEPGNNNAARRKQIKKIEIATMGNRTSPK
jgi:hypothetical protein